MKRFFSIALLLVSWTWSHADANSPADADKLTRMLQQSTLTLLKEGNIRFAEGRSFHPNLEPARRAELADAGQEPIATVLSCSDSRAPLELLFDRGAGDLFVVRVAGNVAGLSELATIEYGVAQLSTPVLLVLGHTHCGVVAAATQNTEAPGHQNSLVSLIKPAVEKARASGPEEELLARAVESNVWQQIQNLIARSAVIREHVSAGKIVIVGAVYDLSSGLVRWLGPHPEWERIVADASAPIVKTEPPATPTTPAPISNVPSQPAPAKSEPVRVITPHAAAAIQKSPIGVPMVSPVTRSEVANSQ